VSRIGHRPCRCSIVQTGIVTHRFDEVFRFVAVDWDANLPDIDDAGGDE